MPREALHHRFYLSHIAEATLDIDPRHVEAWMRGQHPTLDGLTQQQFNDAMYAASAAAMDAGPEQCEALAATFGL